MTKLKKLPEPKEADEQRHLFFWARMMSGQHPELELLNASMNGAWIPGRKGRKFAIITQLQNIGCLRPGFPDINLPIPRAGYHGLYIELKRKSGGKVSKDQQWWLDKLRYQGYYSTVARGFEEAKEAIIMYLMR